MVEFLNNNLLSIYHIFDDLITTINFQHSKILDCGIKSKNVSRLRERKNLSH